MTQIGEPIEVYEAPAPIDVPTVPEPETTPQEEPVEVPA
jgi:hypothetical protein